MALPSSTPALQNADLFLLDRSSATYKITFSELSENIILYLQGGGPDSNNNVSGKLAVNDLIDASTVLKRDPTGGNAAIPGALNDNKTQWLLQYSQSNKQFVLSDPANFLDQALILNNLGDVSVLDANGDYKVQVVPGQTAAPVATKYDTMLVVTNTTSGPGGQPLHEAVNFSDIFHYLIDPSQGGGNSIIIELDHITDISPGGTIDGSGNTQGRLDISLAFLPGIPDTSANWKPKYTYEPFGLKKDDDILVYISKPDLYVSNNSTAKLKAGWYYAAAEFGDVLEPAGSTGGDDSLDDGATIVLGGVRVLQYKNTILGDNNQGGKKVTDYPGKTGGTLENAAGVPTNIGITSDGVLFSTIPNTLSFVKSIDIVGATGIEVFNGGGNVKPQGPGNSVDPEIWNDSDADKLPETGDFYVIRFVDSQGNTDKLEQHNLEWNKYYPIGSPDNSGPVLPVREGDMVAFGTEQWAVIGTVDTETVAQDLQSVTDRGNTTTNAIFVGVDVGADPVFGSAVGKETLYVEGIAGAAQSRPGASDPVVGDGDIVAKRLVVNSIDFTTIPSLT